MSVSWNRVVYVHRPAGNTAAARSRVERDGRRRGPTDRSDVGDRPGSVPRREGRGSRAIGARGSAPNRDPNDRSADGCAANRNRRDAICRRPRSRGTRFAFVRPDSKRPENARTPPLKFDIFYLNRFEFRVLSIFLYLAPNRVHCRATLWWPMLETRQNLFSLNNYYFLILYVIFCWVVEFQ